MYSGNVFIDVTKESIEKTYETTEERKRKNLSSDRGYLIHDALPERKILVLLA